MSSPSEGTTAGKLRALAIELLRIGIGLIWSLNLVFVIAPQNDYFGGFSALALSFGPTTVGGPGLPQFVAAHAAVFSWLVAIVTGYLAVGFLLGLTTRWACLVGGAFSAVLLATQVGSTFVFPGGTDIGEHPIYMLVYVVLVVGGAGEALSVDHWLATAWARRRALRHERPTRAPRPSGALTLDSRFYFAYFAAGTLLAFAVTLGLMVAIPPASTTSGTPTGPVSYENLTISINPINGWPQYSPANFTVPTGRVVFTIFDHDSPMNWSGCQCVVGGTEGDVEYVNGTAVHELSNSNVAHTFNVPNLGLAVYCPGDATIRFTVDLINPGQFLWFCFAPCGAGANPYTTPPMGVAGYMTGTMSIS
jgi:uncharacterized membrane protein YphA (DoxX/SURF4 family)